MEDHNSDGTQPISCFAYFAARGAETMLRMIRLLLHLSHKQENIALIYISLNIFFFFSYFS